ncbi:hypothetical protein BGX26_007592 [Mortierella sp. AD094]|nr:hypothetical protein BGX26_007592 [Mortierella sp. AD094]
MKFLAASTVISTIAAVASAQSFFINDPAKSTVWTTGEPAVISWTGSCESYTTTPQAVPIQLWDADFSTTQSFADLGTLDCSSLNGGNATITVPSTGQSGAPLVPGGNYHLVILENVTQNFSIKNSTSPAPTTSASASASSTATSSTSAGSTPAPTTTKSGAEKSLVAGTIASLVGVATAAFQFIL